MKNQNTIEFRSTQSGGVEETRGSDDRLNVTSRNSSRGYYNSRDKGQVYAAAFQHTAGTAGQYSFYLENTSSDKKLVITSIDVSAVVTSRFKLWHAGSGTAGDAVVPVNLNKDSTNVAECTMLQDNSTTIATVSPAGTPISDFQIGTLGNKEINFEGKIRLGENDAIALELDTSAGSLVHGVVNFYFE